VNRFKSGNFKALIGFTACVALLLGVSASSAIAALPPLKLTTVVPDHGAPGRPIVISLRVGNQSGAAIDGQFILRFALPPTVTFGESRSTGPTPFECEATGALEECHADVSGLFPPSRVLDFRASANISAAATGQIPIGIEVEAAETGATALAEKVIKLEPLGPFAIRSFAASAPDAEGSPVVQAGAHPSSLENVIEPSYETIEKLGLPILNTLANTPAANPRDIVVHLPPGFVGAPGSMPRCTAAQLATNATPHTQNPSCPADSQVGLVNLEDTGGMIGLFNMVPPPGIPAAFGFSFFGVTTQLYTRVRPGDHGIDVVSPEVVSSIPLPRIETDFWGVPADRSHDNLRGLCLDGSLNLGTNGAACPSGEASDPRAFFRTPTACTGEPLRWGLEVDTYQHPGVFADAETTMPPIEGCENVPFEPSITVQPTTHRADSPTGLNVDLTMPQEALQNPNGIAQADVKDTTVVQPVGTRVNPAVADGLSGCSLAQIGYEGNRFPLPNPIHFSGAEPACPDSSKIGTVEIESPLIPDKLEGSIYQAKQSENPFGSTLAFYAVADADGVMIKLPAEVRTDPRTGQVTTVFRDSPELPFEHYKLHFFGGSRAPLITPPTCGTKTTDATLTGWANPEKPVHDSDSFQVTEGANGGPCPATEAARPFGPSFEAGTTYPAGGEFTSFVLEFGREDGSQEFSTIETTLPEGLLGKLKGIPYCPQAAIEAAQRARGAGEQAASSCPAASQIGIADAAAGSGPSPFHQPGKVYLAGPYKGAPLSLVVVTPALAGPLDLGTVVVRAALHVNPETTQITAVSDPIPSLLEEGGDGFPLDVRQVVVQIDREGFALNPTSCEPMAITGRISALQGASANVSSRFQARGCGKLGFEPKLALRLKGKTKRSGHPALRATLTMPEGGANISRATVSLPHSEFLAQGHLGDVCTRVQYHEGGGGGERCPARSVYGRARAFSPLLDAPLEGNVYLRSNGGERTLPDLVASLNGQIHVDLVGYVGSNKKTEGLRTSFATVPDAPVSKFVLTMPAGKHSLLENSTDICRGAHDAIVQMDGHNGGSADSKVKLSVAGCGAGRHTGHDQQKRHG
jgi:hypothetical protein